MFSALHLNEKSSHLQSCKRAFSAVIECNSKKFALRVRPQTQSTLTYEKTIAIHSPLLNLKLDIYSFAQVTKWILLYLEGPVSILSPGSQQK